MGKVVLVGVERAEESAGKVEEYLDELEFLSETVGLKSIKRFTQKLDRVNPRSFVGRGKLEEIAQFVEGKEIELVVFDDELSPTQQRNIEAELKCRVIDRTSLILDIFALRAKSAYAITQVELAQYQYLLPRLAGMWTHLERQKGGIGLRGPGERQIETDRRIILDKITKLKERLGQIDRQMATQRGNRGSFIRVALVGYTNVGKSTVMNLLAKSELFAENKLFATLDTTIRKVVIENLPFLLSDTVGFIRKLPHQLVESFKSTLDEVRESDLLLHVVDVSHPNFEEQIKVVKSTLNEIGAKNKPQLLIFNKIDKYRFFNPDPYDFEATGNEIANLEELKRSWMGKSSNETIFISALDKTNIEELKEKLYTIVAELHSLRYPYNDFLWEKLD
ncbi:MAG: GTPase HflX [Bacteroidales bacterium]